MTTYAPSVATKGSSVTVKTFLNNLTSHVKDCDAPVQKRFLVASQSSKATPQGPVDVHSLRERLVTDPPKGPVFLTVRGTFFPAVLLYAGWWERKARARAAEPDFPTPLQSWLFFGFKEWAPSWDISPSGQPQKDAALLGQLGSGDEADSLALLVSGERAKKVRQDLLGDRMTFEAEVTGLLCHRDHLERPERERLRLFGDTFAYCLRLDDEDPRHRIERRSGVAPIYSGYLWQCLLPKDQYEPKRVPRIEDAFFIWEHTDFTKPDALAYNLDSLQHKAEYLRSRRGDLVLLQKSCALVPGEPVYPTEEFYRFILPRSS